MAEEGGGSRELCIVPIVGQQAKTNRKYRRWTAAEDRILIEHCPDYVKICSLLPDRALSAIQVRCHNMGITGKYKPWTNKDIDNLRKCYPVKRWADLHKVFPNRLRGSIRGMAIILGLRRSSVEHRHTGIAIIDEIRDRARIIGVSLKSLDHAVGSKSYFQLSSRTRFVRYDLVENAMKALGGQIVIVWQE